jgi:heptosyltransferase-2
MMHIAAALKKPIRSIWGSTLSEFGFWPYYGDQNQDTNISFEVKNLSCRPCARFGRNACPKGHFDCMMKQDFDRLI